MSRGKWVAKHLFRLVGDNTHSPQRVLPTSEGHSESNPRGRINNVQLACFAQLLECGMAFLHLRFFETGFLPGSFGESAR